MIEGKCLENCVFGYYNYASNKCIECGTVCISLIIVSTVGILLFLIFFGVILKKLF